MILNGALCLVRAVRGTATGFAFLDPRFVVTARHVVTDQPAGQALSLLFGATDVRARVAFLHPRVDLALLELLDPPPCRNPLRPHEGGGLHPPLWRAGFHAARDEAARVRYAAFVSAVRRFEATTRRRDGDTEDLFMFAAPDGGPGDSGGPVMADDGTVVAVVINGIRIAGEHYIRATAIAPLLDHATSPMTHARLDSGDGPAHA